MSVTQWGIVYYADDPDKKVFRIVYPEFDDRELDGPVTGHLRQILKDDNGHSDWHTFGIHPDRKAIMVKVPVGDLRAVLTGKA